MLLLASLIFWSLAVSVGGLLLIGLIAVVCDCDFAEAAVGALVIVGIFGVIWVFSWSGSYLKAQHVWPWS